MLRVTTLYASSATATAAYYTRYLAAGAGRGAGRVVAAARRPGSDSPDGSTPTICEALLEGRDPIIGDTVGQRVARPDVGGREGGAGGGRVRRHVLGAEVAECVVGAHR